MAGNPAENIPLHISSGGFVEIYKFLKQKWDETNNIHPVSDTIIRKYSKTDTNATEDSLSNPKRKQKSLSADFSNEYEKELRGLLRMLQKRQKKAEMNGNLEAAFCVSGYPPAAFPAKKLFSPEKQAREELRQRIMQERMEYENRWRRHSTPRYVCHKPGKVKQYSKKIYDPRRIQEKTIKQIYFAQMRETLEKQAQILQRMKDAEVLKSWRRKSIRQEDAKVLDNYQQYSVKEFGERTPFDIDPEYFSMLNRSDLRETLRDMEAKRREKRKPKPIPKMSIYDLDKQIADIMHKLEELDRVEAEDTESPRQKQVNLAEQIAQIQQLQLTLRNLKSFNHKNGAIIKRSRCVVPNNLD